jgi:hypothetical protein
MLDLGVWRSRRHASRRARTTETRHVQVSMNGVLSRAQTRLCIAGTQRLRETGERPTTRRTFQKRDHQ